MNNYEYSKMLEDGVRYAFYVQARSTRNLLTFSDWLFAEHTEPMRLTDEERKAAELAVVMGLPWIANFGEDSYIGETKKDSYVAVWRIPRLRILKTSKWITKTPIDLREVLKNDV